MVRKKAKDMKIEINAQLKWCHPANWEYYDGL
jgi:hypothetical protein